MKQNKDNKDNKDNKEKRFVSKKELLIYVAEFLYSHCDDNELIKILNESFSSKGLMVKIPSLLMDIDSSINVYNISNVELITLIDTLYKIQGDERLNPEYYFSDLELDEYESYKGIPTDIIDSIILKNGIKVSDQQWIFYITLRDCYLMNKNMLVRYNIQTQRKSNYKEIGTKGFGINEISLNESAVQSIKEEFKRGIFTPNLITFNVLVQKGKVAQFKPEDGNVTIIPNYNRKSDKTTYVDCIDGYHRFTAACLAYKEGLEEGKDLQGGLVLSLVRMTTEEARSYIVREFKRSSTNTEWLESIEENDYTKMADKIINNMKLERIGLDNFVGLIHEDIKYKGKITTRSVIVDALKYCKVPVNNMSVVVLNSKEIGELVTLLIDYLADRYFDSDHNKMLKESYLLDCNMFFLYVVIMNGLLEDDNKEEKILEIADKLYNLNDQKEAIESVLQLKNKNYNINKMIEFIENKLM